MTTGNTLTAFAGRRRAAASFAATVLLLGGYAPSVLAQFSSFTLGGTELNIGEGARVSTNNIFVTHKDYQPVHKFTIPTFDPKTSEPYTNRGVFKSGGRSTDNAVGYNTEYVNDGTKIEVTYQGWAWLRAFNSAGVPAQFDADYGVVWNSELKLFNTANTSQLLGITLVAPSGNSVLDGGNSNLVVTAGGVTRDVTFNTDQSQSFNLRVGAVQTVSVFNRLDLSATRSIPARSTRQILNFNTNADSSNPVFRDLMVLKIGDPIEGAETFDAVPVPSPAALPAALLVMVLTLGRRPAGRRLVIGAIGRR